MIDNRYIAGYDPISPGDKASSFTIYFSENYFKKGEFLDISGGRLKITKTYNNRWRRFLLWLGFNVKLYNAVKVKPYE